ncbi:MAG: hypothetical protein AABX70_05575 [Nanoarchaeota archaeon]
MNLSNDCAVYRRARYGKPDQVEGLTSERGGQGDYKGGAKTPLFHLK